MASSKMNEHEKADSEIMNVLNFGAIHVTQKDRNVECTLDTGQWFFGHPEYQAFQAAQGLQLLFVTAEAGGGKSTVMSTFIDRLQNSHDRPAVAYFFFKDDDDQLRSYEDALSSLMYQLFVQESSLVQHARELYTEYGHGVRYQTKKLWSVLLAAAAQTDRDLVCVLDAVDECAPSGRRQLVSDLACAFGSEEETVSRKLKLVVTSRPYQDENHPYADLIATNTIRHLAGEDARVQSDIQKVIRSKAKELAQKHELDFDVERILVDAISGQNLQTRSFMAVQMAFELLDSHELMRAGAKEAVIRAVLADIPRTLGDQFDKMLNKSLDREHARRLFCVIISARKTLKISELKVIYALTRARDNSIGSPRSYNDLELPGDKEFKNLIRARCGLFITFVGNSVHLFHQTAREHLMGDLQTTFNDSLDDKATTRVSRPQIALGRYQQPTWEGCITEEEANFVMMTVCVDLFNFEVPRSWVLDVFDGLNAGNEIQSDMKDLLQDKPFLQYAAISWTEHAILSGDLATEAFRLLPCRSILDISKPAFWIWFLILADYICSADGRTKSLAPSIWEDEDRKLKYVSDYGGFLREGCFKTLFDLDRSIQILLNDPSESLPEISHQSSGLYWTASDGYDLVDQYHLSYGQYEYTSISVGAQCIEFGQLERASLLFNRVAIPKVIWTCISDGAALALEKTLGPVKDLGWLYKVPEHIVYRRELWHGTCSLSGKDFRRERDLGWDKPWSPAFAAIARALNDSHDSKIFSALADWLESSPDIRGFASQIWNVGGFLEPSLCRRLVQMGAQIDAKCGYHSMSAIHIAAALWEHDIVDTLIDLGADTKLRTQDGLTALQLFFRGPENSFTNERRFWPTPGRECFQKLPSREQQRLRKIRIRSTVQALYKTSLTSMDDMTTEGRHPLMLAAQTSPTATQGLIQAGAAIDQTDRQGRTALMHFFCGEFEGRSTKTLEYLLDAGADNVRFDAAGHSVLQFWARQVFAMDLGSLYPGFNRFNKSFQILTSTGTLSEGKVLVKSIAPLKFPLVAAVRLGNSKLTLALCAAGVSPNKHGLTTKTRLAESRGTVSDRLANLNWNPLLVALMHKAYTNAVILLAYGADVGFQTPWRKRTRHNRFDYSAFGTTALHVAVQRKHQGHYHYGMSLGTGYDACCKFSAIGHAELPISQQCSELELARYSLESWKKTDTYKSRFLYESSDSEFEIPKRQITNDWTGDKLLPYDRLTEDMFRNIRTKLDDTLFFDVLNQELTPELRQNAIVELLIKKGAPVNARTQEGRTPLHVAGSLELVRILLKHGADTNIAATENGETPLMQAAASGQRDFVEVLLSAGADPNAQMAVAPLIKRKCCSFIDWNDQTMRKCDAPLTAMAVAAKNGHHAVVELLLKHGADPNKPIEHHVHGRIPSKRSKLSKLERAKLKQESREWKPYYSESDLSDSDSDSDSQAKVVEYKGYISVGTALTWARGEVRELLLKNGADPGKEKPLEECGCAVIERRRERRVPWVSISDDDLPSQSDGDDSDANLRRHKYIHKLAKWDGGSDESD